MKITFTRPWKLKEIGTSLSQSYRDGVVYNVTSEVAIAAAKDKVTQTPEALALLKTSGQKPNADPALSKMTKEEMTAEIKTSRDQTKQLETTSAELKTAKAELKTSNEMNAAISNTADEAVKAYNAASPEGTQLAETLEDVITGLKALSASSQNGKQA